MLIELPEYYSKFRKISSVSYFDLNINFFKSSSITFFSFTCHASVLPIYSELVNPNEKRMMKVVTRSVVVDCLFYCSIALVGYFSTLDFTPDLVIAREKLFEHDYAMTISNIAIIIVVLVSSPANYFPFKNTLNYMLNDGREMTQKL